MYKIFPCNSDKKPLIKDWQTLATTDQSQIAQWQNYFRESIAYWGVPTGQSNDIYVLDIDVKNDENGFKSITDHNLQIPTTTSQTTRSGGKHYIFKYPKDGKHYGNRTKFLKGLDTRGEGGYIIYYGTDDIPTVDAPEWLLNFSGAKELPKGEPIKVSPTITAEILHSALENIRNATDGERNHTLNVEAFRIGQLVSSGSISKEYAEQVLTKAAQDNGVPGFKATIQSGLKGGDNKPIVGPFSAPPVVGFEIPIVEQPKRWTPNKIEIADLFNTDHLKRPQLFQDWSTEDIHITVADGGTGKSTLKLYESVCLALGRDFLGFKNVQQGKTLYITGEDSEKKLAAMIGQILKQMGLNQDVDVLKTIVDSISIKKDDSLCLISKDGSNFLSPNTRAMDMIRQAVEDLQPKMIVIDPIASFWGSESLVNDMGKAVSKFVAQLVHESNACVEMINHAGKISSNTKDMSQFAGRGGTGLVSHARVARVLRSVDHEEYTELTNRTLEDWQTGILCNVNKFSDGSPLLNKPFVIVRDKYGFEKHEYEVTKAQEERTKEDTVRIFNFIKECRNANKFPTKPLIIAHFMSQKDRLSESKVKNALGLIEFDGINGQKIRQVENPDLTSRDRVYIITDMEGNEL